MRKFVFFIIKTLKIDFVYLQVVFVDDLNVSFKLKYIIKFILCISRCHKLNNTELK
jgi:hypothetical protein